jgi:hypothetical protein
MNDGTFSSYSDTHYDLIHVIIIQNARGIIMYIGDFLYSAVIISLLLLGSISFTLFIRRLLINTRGNVNTSDDINKKLDRIIELLENQSEKF